MTEQTPWVGEHQVASTSSNVNINPPIRPSIMPFFEAVILHRVMGNLIPHRDSGHKVGRVQSHTLTNDGHFRDISQPLIIFGLWSRVGNLCTLKKPPNHRENIQNSHTGRRQESNLQPWKCKASALTPKPLVSRSDCCEMCGWFALLACGWMERVWMFCENGKLGCADFSWWEGCVVGSWVDEGVVFLSFLFSQVKFCNRVIFLSPCNTFDSSAVLYFNSLHLPFRK